MSTKQSSRSNYIGADTSDKLLRRNLLITYNHAAYMRKALNERLMHQVQFDLEIVVANDTSTDGIAAIIVKYVARTPHLYQALAHDINLGANRNVNRGLGTCRGRHMAQ